MLFLEIVFFSLLGIAFGVLTGLVPGLHPNTVYFILISFLPLLSKMFPDPLLLLVFIVSLGVCNTFTDFIPSVIFGVPEEDTCVSVPPAQRFVMEGRGYEALFLSVIGGLSSIFLIFISIPFILKTFPLIYSMIKGVLFIPLSIVLIYMVATEKKKAAAAFVCAASGFLGVVTLGTFHSSSVIFPSLSGFFGASALVFSIRMGDRIKKQKVAKYVNVNVKRGMMTGFLGGLFSGLFPGVSPSQSGMIVSSFLNTSRRDFITALGGINTANITMTLLVFYSMGRIRSGMTWTLSEVGFSFDESILFILLSVCVFSSLLSSFLTLRLGKFILKNVENVDYKRMNVLVLVVLFLLVLSLSGPYGLLVFISSTFIGLFTISQGVKRSNMMSYLLIPTILYYSGLTSPFLSFLAL